MKKSTAKDMGIPVDFTSFCVRARAGRPGIGGCTLSREFTAAGRRRSGAEVKGVGIGDNNDD